MLFEALVLNVIIPGFTFVHLFLLRLFGTGLRTVQMSLLGYKDNLHLNFQVFIRCYLLNVHARQENGLQVTKIISRQSLKEILNIQCFFEIFSEYAEKLFDLVDNFAESSKRKAAVWPLQIMLLILCPVRKYLVIHTIMLMPKCIQ